MEPAADLPDPSERWLLLIHSIPPKPDYLRVKIGRRLQRVGAIPVKNSVYVLPASNQAHEDFQWIRVEIVEGGGDAIVCHAEFVDGMTDDQARELFREARARDFAEIAAGARRLLETINEQELETSSLRQRAEDDLARLKKRFTSVTRLDFFEASARTETQALLDAVDARITPSQRLPYAEGAGLLDRAQYRARTWVTREGIFVDRIASAWLIVRFIDPDARFKFVPPRGYAPKAGELRFDMFDAEFTHEGEHCTFETLLARFGLEDPALRSLAEIVHDIDLKDARYERADTAGIERVLAGIARAHQDDAARLERGRQLFDELYALHAAEVAAIPSAMPSPQ
ncbi:MAG: chromate resistance protein ChrB domain-containing protein [Gemmatimonadaceae bacterium]